jgi:integrase
MDCENYFLERTKGKKNLRVSPTTVANEQATINALMKWLHKRGETYIDGFDFKKLPRVDTGDEANRRNTFTDEEIDKLVSVLDGYIKEAERDLLGEGNVTKAITGYYLGVSLISGLRRGEQLQLTWSDVYEMEHEQSIKNPFDLIKITVRGSTSKVRKTRRFVVKDEKRYFTGMMKLALKLRKVKIKEAEARDYLEDDLIFSADGKAPITIRALGYHFDKLLRIAEIKTEGRDLVPYSFRHYFITKRVNSNLPAAAIAEMCGTSITQIEKTYYHTTEEKMVSNALANYKYVDGMLVPI